MNPIQWPKVQILKEILVIFEVSLISPRAQSVERQAKLFVLSSQMASQTSGSFLFSLLIFFLNWTAPILQSDNNQLKLRLWTYHSGPISGKVDLTFGKHIFIAYFPANLT